MREVVVVARYGAEGLGSTRRACDDVVFAGRMRGDGALGSGEDDPGGGRVAVGARDVRREGQVCCASFEGDEGDGD